MLKYGYKLRYYGKELYMGNKYFDWVRLFPNYVVVRKEGCYYSARNESAQILHEILGYKLGTIGTGTLITGCPIVEPIVEALVCNKINFIIIENNEITDKQEFEESNFESLNVRYELEHKKVATFINNSDNKSELLEFLNTLLLGIDPNTGEIFDENHIMSCEYMNQILLLAHKSLIKKCNEQKPSFAGSKWTDEEDMQLKEEYESHIPIKEIAEIHERSKGAINSRLIKLYPELLKLTDRKSVV